MDVQRFCQAPVDDGDGLEVGAIFVEFMPLAQLPPRSHWVPPIAGAALGRSCRAS